RFSPRTSFIRGPRAPVRVSASARAGSARREAPATYARPRLLLVARGGLPLRDRARRDALGRGLPPLHHRHDRHHQRVGWLPASRRARRPGDATHIIGMGASYIALLTAFYIDNGKTLPGCSASGLV